MKRITVCTGGFDPLHSGHIAYFKEAKKLGDELWVGVNSDEWLVRKKGQAFLPFLERSEIVRNIGCVDNVVDFSDDDIGSSINCIKKVLAMTGFDSQVIFANGGDRNSSNIPELKAFQFHPRVEFAWGIGGNNKKNSSSWILEEWKRPNTFRKWGWYKVLDDKPGYKVKELVIEPGKSLSMQYHNFRAEHWFCLKGQCDLHTEYNGNKNSIRLSQFSHGFFIGKTVWHQAVNNGTENCHILEVQYGEKCVEEDIVRRDET